MAHLSADQVPTVSLFANAVSPATGPGAGRVTVHHTAPAPAVDLYVRRGVGAARPTVIPGLLNGNSVTADLPPGNWFASLSPAGSSATAFGPASVQLKPRNLTLVFAIGSLADGSFTVVEKTVSVND